MRPFHIRLPATSANLGPGFDTLAIALDLWLEITAEASDQYSIEATGRNVDLCTQLRRNLILSVYEEVFREQGGEPLPLALKMTNGIPIGMGCGSSAAARLAGIALANHFGGLGWTNERILVEASRLEGHPDNAAACWLGGFTVAMGEGEKLRAVAIDPAPRWTALLVLPDQPLLTTTARAVLPDEYSHADVVANVQAVALLTAAFQLRRADLLQFAMADRLHQPFRSEICPLLPILLPLAGRNGIAGVALSGAGPAVLAIVTGDDDRQVALHAIHDRLPTGERIEVCPVQFCRVIAR